MTEFSIIVTTYNQEYEKIILTIDSILGQNDSDKIEIIITDDGSKKEYLDDLSNYLERKGFNNYKIIKNKVNVGTVKNCLIGLQNASSEYAMILSTGDLLSQENIVNEMLTFLKEKKTKVASGGIKRYTYENGTLTTGTFHLGNPADLEKGKDSILEQQLLMGNWLSGGSLFFKREEFIRWITELSNEYHVIYCEDFCSVISVLHGNKLEAFDKQIMWYEWGCGISSSGSKSSVQRTYLDYERFLKEIHIKYRKNKIITKAYRKFSVKNMLVKHLYGVYSFIRGKFEKIANAGFKVLINAETAEEKYLKAILH